MIKKILILFLLFVVHQSTAQDFGRMNFMETPSVAFPSYSQYEHDNGAYMNNSIFQYGNLPLLYRMSLSGRFGIKKHGIGTSFYTAINQDIYSFRYQLGYSYAIQLSDDLFLQPGIDLNIHQVKYNRVFTSGNPNDTTTINTGRTSVKFDTDVGVTITGKTFDIYFAFANIIAPQFLYSNNYRSLRLMVRNRFSFMENFGFTPTIYVQNRMLPGNFFNINDPNTYADLQLKFDYLERFWLSGNYRTLDYLGFRIGGNVKGLYFYYGVLAQVGQSTALPGASYYHDIGVGFLWNKKED